MKTMGNEIIQYQSELYCIDLYYVTQATWVTPTRLPGAGWSPARRTRAASTQSASPAVGRQVLYSVTTF